MLKENEQNNKERLTKFLESETVFIGLRDTIKGLTFFSLGVVQRRPTLGSGAQGSMLFQNFKGTG